VNSYQDKSVTFAELLRQVNAVKGDFWIRFTSPHPKDFSDDLIKAMTECKKFPHYLNLPAQSGNDEVLKKMNRPYTIEHYKNIIKKIRATMPGIAISTDVIVGFPGETRKQFLDTAKLMREVKFDLAYLSEYSPRSKTLAAERFKDNVPHTEKERRKNELNEILKKTSYEFNKNLIGKTVTVLNGRTEHNKLIQLNKECPKNTFVKAVVTHASVWSLKGKLVE
jgi:tRNA-2-methylthio-N6-dimethylallyladenosine synthase